MLNELIEKFSEEHGNFRVLYGGDGTLISEWRNCRKKCLLPVRNYGMCEKHAEFYRKLLDGSLETPVRQFLFPTIEVRGHGLANEFDTEALSEVVLMNRDITQCMRTNIYINGSLANSNVLSSGLIVSTKLGSTGYFKSISRTIFRNGIGLAFISPTYSIPNIILDKNDEIAVEFVRSTEIDVACDKLKYVVNAEKNSRMTISSTCGSVSIFGYDHFMCEDCRRNRNSTMVNDSYIVN